MYPQLTALTEGPNLLVDKPILLVGRHEECDVQIPSRKISRKHCCISQVDNRLVVRDLSSTNGVRVNGHRVDQGELRHGDELTIGNLVYRVHWPQKPKDGVQVGLPPVDPETSTERPIALPEDRSPAPLAAPALQVKPNGSA